MIGIDISYESDEMMARAPRDTVEAVLMKVLELVGKGSCELSCSFVSENAMRDLNASYRDKDESTDILSFVQSEGDDGFDFPSDEDSPELLGDIIISLDDMEKNCEFFSVDPSQELSRLLVHGVLHLVGWDHATNEMDEPMLIKQEELLKIVEKESIS
jgi:probable rRNA maturation factor